MRQKSAAGFVKGQTLRFDEDGGSAPVVPPKQPPRQQQQQQQQQQQHAHDTRSHSRQQHAEKAPSTAPAAAAAPADGGSGEGVGWALLKKAGWRPGAGLGKNESGDTQPLAPRAQRTTRGLGHKGEGLVLVDGALRPAAAAAAATGDGAAAPAAGAAGRAPGAALAVGAGSQQLIGPAQLPRKRRRGAGGGTAGEELDPEIKSAAERAVAEERKYKAIQAALRREFAAPSHEGGGDSNPLTRRSKLSATNPLLGDSDDEFG